MNQQERDALREKHRVGQNEADNQCQACYSPDGYPCDTIKVLDAWEDTTEYPPEGQNEECDHTDDNGLCWCESGFKRCPECHEWFGIDHARKDMTATNVVTESASVSATWLGSCPHQADSRLLPGVDLTTEIATSVVEECECGEEL